MDKREKTMATQIARVGTTVLVEIPEELLQRANLAVGDPVEWTLTPSGTLALRTPNTVDETKVEDGYEEWALAEIQAGLDEAESGETVPHERVVEWLRSWGTPNELPPPLCN
jgi:antitoxin component of MazEF toxin-antitoxin module